jgi:hypothetical protein
LHLQHEGISRMLQRLSRAIQNGRKPLCCRPRRTVTQGLLRYFTSEACASLHQRRRDRPVLIMTNVNRPSVYPSLLRRSMASTGVQLLNQALTARVLGGAGESANILIDDGVDEIDLFFDILEALRSTICCISRLLSARLGLSYGDLCSKRSNSDGDHHVALTIDNPSVVTLTEEDAENSALKIGDAGAVQRS